MLDPGNIKPIVYLIADHLSKILPAQAPKIKSNRKQFINRFELKLKEWKDQMAPFADTPVVTYHRTWSYFLRYFHLTHKGTVEPKPGIQPSPSHLSDLAQRMKQKNIHLILQANYYQDKFSKLLADKSGARVLTLPTGVGGVSEAGDTIKLFDYLVSQITRALSSNE
jgi:ABC-type Zn uptake system ZnuABC Zn-binding protein ZnuA